MYYLDNNKGNVTKKTFYKYIINVIIKNHKIYLIDSQLCRD